MAARMTLESLEEKGFCIPSCDTPKTEATEKKESVKPKPKPKAKRKKKIYVHKRTEPVKAKIGIDTGVKTGVAVWEDQALQVVTSMTIVKAMTFIIQNYPVETTKLYIEDARKWVGWKGKTNDTEQRRKGAGSIQRDAKIWEDWCKDMGYDYLMIKPMGKGLKKNAADFKRITGWMKLCNEHARDAAMIVFQR